MFQRFSFFKQPTNRVFEYQPRYYDERKERIRQKMKEAEQQHKGEMPDRATLERRISFKDQMSSRWSPGYRSQANKSNFRVVIILAVLLGIFYILFNQVDELSQWFTN